MEDKINPNDVRVFVKGKEYPWDRARGLRDLLRNIDFSILKTFQADPDINLKDFNTKAVDNHE